MMFTPKGRGETIKDLDEHLKELNNAGRSHCPTCGSKLAEEKRTTTIPDDEKLAMLMHEQYCDWNHTDGCGWEYEIDRGNVWEQNAHKRWLERARELLEDHTFDGVINMMKHYTGLKKIFWG